MILTYDLLFFLVIGFIVCGSLVTHISLKAVGKDENNIFIVFVALFLIFVTIFVFNSLETPLAQPTPDIDLCLTKDTTCYNSNGDAMGVFQRGTTVTLIGKTTAFWNWAVVMLDGETYCIKITDLESSMYYYDGELVPINKLTS